VYEAALSYIFERTDMRYLAAVALLQSQSHIKDLLQGRPVGLVSWNVPNVKNGKFSHPSKLYFQASLWRLRAKAFVPTVECQWGIGMCEFGCMGRSWNGGCAF
jgi:hypothetical protein